MYSNTLFQCFHAPMTSTTLNIPIPVSFLPDPKFSHFPTFQCPHTGCCMSVSSPCLSNPDSSLCLSPSHYACDCVCCDWPGLKGKHRGKGKCRTAARLCKFSHCGWFGGLVQSVVCAGIMIYIRETLGSILNRPEGGLHFWRDFPQRLDYLHLFTLKQLSKTWSFRHPRLFLVNSLMFGMEEV